MSGLGNNRRKCGGYLKAKCFDRKFQCERLVLRCHACQFNDELLCCFEWAF